MSFASSPRLLVDHRRFVEDFRELPPFRILPGASQSVRQRLEMAQRDKFGFEFGDRSGGGGAVRDRLLGVFEFLAADFVEVAVLVVFEDVGEGVATLQQAVRGAGALFGEPRFEALASTPQ
jgi:hypothetical protein